MSVDSSITSLQRKVEDNKEKKGQSPQGPAVEVITPEIVRSYDDDGSRGPFSGIWSRRLRVKITGRDGFERLDVRIPVSIEYKMSFSVSCLSLCS